MSKSVKSKRNQVYPARPMHSRLHEIYGTKEWDELPDGNDVPWVREHINGTVYRSGPEIDYCGEAELIEVDGLKIPNTLCSKYIFSHVIPAACPPGSIPEEAVTVPWLDLQIFFLVHVETEARLGPKFLTYLMTRDLLETKGLDVQQLYEAAVNNSRGRVISSSLAELLGLPAGISEIYVLTTNPINFGAAAPLLATDELKRLSRRQNSPELLIIPSSVHEILAMPLKEHSQESINEIIEHVNRTEVSAGDRLSDHCYFYHSVTDEFSY